MAIMNTESSSGVFTQRCIVHSNTGGWSTLGGGSMLLFNRQRRRSRRQCSPAVEDERATPTKGEQNIKPGQSGAQQLKNALASPRTASACLRQRAVQPPGMGHSVQGTLDQPEAPASSVHPTLGWHTAAGDCNCAMPTLCRPWSSQEGFVAPFLNPAALAASTALEAGAGMCWWQAGAPPSARAKLQGSKDAG